MTKLQTNGLCLKVNLATCTLLCLEVNRDANNEVAFWAVEGMTYIIGTNNPSHTRVFPPQILSRSHHRLYLSHIQWVKDIIQAFLTQISSRRHDLGEGTRLITRLIKISGSHLYMQRLNIYETAIYFCVKIAV